MFVHIYFQFNIAILEILNDENDFWDLKIGKIAFWMGVLSDFD